MSQFYPRFWRYLLIIAGVAIAYFGTAVPAILVLNINAKASPFWPPAGVALLAFLIIDRRAIPGIILGDLLLMQVFGGNLFTALGSAAGSILQAMFGAFLLRQINFHPSLERLKDVVGLVVLGAIGSTAINALIDSVVAVLGGNLTWGEFRHNALTTWIGDGMGILKVVPPVLLVWSAWQNPGKLRFLKDVRRKLGRLAEAMLCFSLLAIVSQIVFGCTTSNAIAQYPLEYLPFPLVVWASLRFNQWGAMLSSILLSGIALAGLLQGNGPLLHKALNNFPEALVLLQTYIVVVTITALMLAAAVSERQQVSIQLQMALERDRLTTTIASRIRESLDLDHIFSTTVIEVRQALQADRVFIGHLDTTGQGKVVAESATPHCKPLLGFVLDDQLLAETQQHFSNGLVQVMNHAGELKTTPRLHQYYQEYQIRASLVAPILLEGNQLFGLLVAHQCENTMHPCTASRPWQDTEVDLMKQLATQVAIGIQQAQLYQQVQSLNASLEKQVQERTAELEESMAELKKLSKTKDVFIQAISHDLRTSIMGTLMVLKKLPLRANDQIAMKCNLLERMTETSDRQLTLINALSEDHLQGGCPMSLCCRTISLSDLMSQTLASLQPMLQSNQVILENQIPSDLPKINADPLQIQRVLENLLTNAVKHNLPGITLTLKAKLEDDHIHISIQDNGIGIDAQQQTSLFDLYLRYLHNPNRTGIGLGLYLCHQVIQAHQGDIGVISEPGQGATFWFTLPYRSLLMS